MPISMQSISGTARHLHVYYFVLCTNNTFEVFIHIFILRNGGLCSVGKAKLKSYFASSLKHT